MKKNQLQNSRESNTSTILKALSRNLRLFSGFKSAFNVFIALSLVIILVLAKAESVESKRSAEINFGTTETINLFPTKVFTTEWAGVENVLIQDLSEDSLYQEFSARSSAYVSQQALLIPDGSGAPVLIPVADVSSEPLSAIVPSDGLSTTSDSLSDIEVASDNDTDIVLPVVDLEVDGIPSVEVPVEEVSDSQIIIEMAEPEPEPEPELDPASEPISFLDATRSYVNGVFQLAQGFFPLAQLSITSSTVPAVELSSDPDPVVEPDVIDVEEPVVDVEPEFTFDTEQASIEVETSSSSVASDSFEISEIVSEGFAPAASSSTSTLLVEVVSDSSYVDAVVLTEPADEPSVHEIVLEDFDTAPLESGQFINGMQLRLSFAAQLESPASGTIPYVEVLFGSKNKQESVGVILLEDEVSNALNGGYFLFALPAIKNVKQLEGSQVTLRYFGDSEELDGMFLDAAWLELDTRTVTKDDLKNRGIAQNLKTLKAPKLTTLVSDQLNFKRDEKPLFNLRYDSRRNFIVRGLRSVMGKDLVSVNSVEIKHESFGLLGITPNLTVTKEGLLTIEIADESLKNMRPGSYTIELTLNEGGKEFVDTFDFQWGILTINPNKSEYEVEETSQISIGALTTTGHTICDANLDLYVTSPEGFVSKSEVSQSGLCDGNNVIDVPDFSATVPVPVSGVYELYLERLDDSGNVLGFTSDTFNSVPNQQISIERVGPTRIFPPALYPMTLTVSTTKSFTGTITEYVPASFKVFDTDADVTTEGDLKKLVWDISILGAGTEAVSYMFDAPNISPYLFTIGPARIDGEQEVVALLAEVASSSSSSSVAIAPAPVSSNVFIEHRRWQIASDAVGNMLLLWDDGAALPTDWLCVSCTGGDPFFQKMILASSTYNVTGGSANHTHTVSGSVLASSLSATESGAGSISPVSHTHTYSPTISTESNLPAYRQLRVIRYNPAAGEPATIPAGAIGIFDVASSSLPSGWNRYGLQDDTYAYGENTPATTGGSDTDSHTITGSTGAAGGSGTRVRGGTTVAGAAGAHTHAVSSNTVSLNKEPPHITVLLAELSSAAAPPNNLIAMWDADVDSGWVNVSGDSDAFSGRFFKASTTYGTTGGGDTHTPADVTGITSGAPSATTQGRVGSAGADGTHTHSVSATGFSTVNHLPPYATAVFGKRQGTDPVYDQISSLWYVNEAAQTPTDIWPSGGTNLVEKEAITATSTPVKDGDEVRLRVNVGVTNATSSAGATFKLQFVAADTCSAASGWADVGDTSSTTVWRGYNNGGVTDHGTLSTLLLASSSATSTYEENGFSTTTPYDISVGEFGEWDFVLQHNGALAGTNYCFRMVENDGTAFLSYSHYPKLFTNEAPLAVTLEKLFDNEKAPSSTPWFFFVTTDIEGENIHYEIEVDNNYDFSSPEIDRNTISNSSLFENQVLISDKAPFQQGEQIKFVNSASLATSTYYWRVRAQDPDGSADWGDWSTIRSFTIDTTLAASAWYQTQDEQFDTNILAGVKTGGDDADLIVASTSGTMTSSAIDFNDGELGTAWGSLVYSETDGSSVLDYQVEYYDDTDTWTLIPDSDLPNNSTGLGASPVTLLDLDTDIYTIIRVIADFTANTGSPVLLDWTIDWGYRVETPAIAKLFPNEQTGTTTPTFQFSTTDPQADSLTYQISWSTSTDFSASTTRTSGADAGFSNLDAGGDTDPFNSGDDIQFVIQSADVLIGTTTYWWKVRAKDTTGDNAYSFWTDVQSFTVIPGTDVSTWLQTSEEQFDTDILSGTNALTSDSVTVATTASEAMIVYGEGTVNTPRYRQWDGSTLGAEGDMLDVGAPIKWAVVKAATAREEYVAVTAGTDADVNAQVFTTGVWGDLQEVTVSMGSVNARGFDVVYEASSSDAMVVYCDGDPDPSYYIWDGSTWTSGGTINLASTNDCEWIQLAANPTSDEITLISRDTDGTGAASYEAMVWNGSSWSTPATQGGARDTAYETMAVEYEESGGQALTVSGDGVPVRFEYNSLSGAAWAGVTTNSTISDNLIWAELVRDVGSDNMVMCYVDESVNIGAIRWTGAAWTGQADLDVAGNAVTDRSVSCVYETSSGRDGNIMALYSDTTNARYQFYNGSVWSTEASISTITDVSTIQSVRAGDGVILGLFYDDVNDQIDFSDWNGSTWSAVQTIETNASVDTSPYGQPFDITARNSGSEGTTIVSPGVDFDDGTGPYWKTFSWNDSQPVGSEILYHLQYFTSTSSWAFIPDADLPDNIAGTSTGPFDLSLLNTNTYNVIRPYAELTCDGSGNCPALDDWKIEWAGGITISGTAQQYDQAANVTSGTVAVAVNGVLQSGKTSAISAGTWSIANVTVFEGDVVTVFVSSAADLNEAVGVARYDGTSDMDGITLYERHLSLGSNDATTTVFTNADIGQYDYTNTEDVFLDLNGTTLEMCAAGECTDVEFYIQNGSYYTPTGKLVTHDIENNGTLTAGAYTLEVNGSWDNNGTTTMTGSTVVFAATSTTESIDSTGAISDTFDNVTFGTTTGNGVWTLTTALDVDGDLLVERGTLARGATEIVVAGNLTTGANGLWTGISTTTFYGAVTATWDDQNAALQNVGYVVVDGAGKAVTLASNVAAQSINIAANDTLDATVSNYDITVFGDWDNQNNFLARSGEVFFAATSTGQTITTSGDAFFDLTFNGIGGAWSFTETTLLVNNDFTVATGTVTLPTATTTIVGSFDATNGTFVHNNSDLLFTSGSAETITFDGVAFNNVVYDLYFNGSGSWTITDANATATNDVFVEQGTVNFPSGVLAIGGTLEDNGGTFVGGAGTVRFYSGLSEIITAGGSSFNDLDFAGVGDWSFSDTDVTALGDLVVTQGTLALPSGTFSLGGSYSNADTVSAGTGTLEFDSTDAGETIDFGVSSLYNVIFDGINGAWNITNPATTTNDFTLATTSLFTLDSGQVLSVGGVFTNSVASASTTWTGSTLALRAGDYGINIKTNAGDTYAILDISASTDIAMWNSSATTYSVDVTGSLYSQDHSAVDGDLYIFGAYSNDLGAEYWSYNTDFDGMDLVASSSERQVDVRFASGASASFASSTFELLGISTASTTIANQGAGTYVVNVNAGTTTAQYYSFVDLGATGLSFDEGAIVSTLRDGEYAVAAAGGTAITLSSTTIDANPAKQIYNITFATTTAIAAFNVSQTVDTPASFWWFRNGFGNLYGEVKDNDTGDPGSVRFDDSSLVITVSGTVYSDAGTTPIIGGTCDGVATPVRVVVDGGSAYTGSCSNIDGTYSIGGVTVIGDPTLTVYLNGASGGEQGSVITRTPTADITDMDIYANRVIVRNEDTAALTITNLAVYDSSDDIDLQFTATTTPDNDLSVMAGNELYVFASSTFTPGGTVTLHTNATGNSYDGTLYVGDNASFVGATTTTYTIGGRLVLGASSTLISASSTILMNATTTGKSITASDPVTFYDLVLNGVGGGWNLGADIIVDNNMDVTNGTLTGTGDITLTAGSLSGNGVLSMGGGTTTMNVSSTLGGTSAWTFYNLQLGDAVVAGTTTPGFTSTTTISSRLTIATAHFLDTGNTEWDLAGAGTVFVEDGTFLEDTSTVRYSGASSNVLSTQYYNLDINAGAGTPTYTAVGLGIIVDGDLTVGGDATTVFDITSNDPAFDINGDVLVRSNGTLSTSNSADFTIAGSYDNNGTLTSNGGTLTFDGVGTIGIAAGSSDFGSVFVNTTGDVTVSEHATATSLFTVQSANSFTLATGESLAVGGTFYNNLTGAATTWTGSTLRLYGGGDYSINASTSTDSYATLDIDGTTQIRMWNSDAVTYDVSGTGSLYSQDHVNVPGDLYIYGAYQKTNANDFWSYATDFDGTDLSGGSERKVDVFIATSSSVNITGGDLGVRGVASASTTVQTQGTDDYSLLIGGTASTSWQYYEIRDIDIEGLVFAGSPTINTLSYGDLEVSVNTGTAITVGGTVITNNPAKNFTLNRFALSGVAGGFNVTATGTTVSSWRFANHYGDIDGEAFDVDPDGDPGYVTWVDSANLITVSGNVYADEGSTAFVPCDGATNNVTLAVANTNFYSTTCDNSTGAYSISNVSYGSNDSLVVYIDGETEKGATVTNQPVSNVNSLDIYQNRVIVRHENVDPMTIVDMAVYDSSNDADIPFTVAAGNLTLPANYKLIVWDNKDFEPGGNVTLSGGGAGAAYDGTAQLFTGATWTGQGSELVSIGGSFILDSGSAFVSSNGTTTFTTTGAVRTIDINSGDFHHMDFTGSGSWTVTDPILTVNGDLSMSAGTLTLPSGTSTFAGSFVNSGGSFVANGGLAQFTGVGAQDVTLGDSDLAEVDFTSGTYTFGDTNATTTESLTITGGTLVLPSGTLTVGGNFRNEDATVTHNTAEIVMSSTSVASLLASTSDLHSVTFRGGGTYTMEDSSMALLGSLIIESGAVTLPDGVLSIGGSFDGSGGTFTNSTGTILFNSADTGETIDAGSSDFYSVQITAPTGGYTVTANATTTNNFSLVSANSFTLQSGTVLYVGGVFLNSVGGSATTWAGSTLILDGENAYTVNSKTDAVEQYQTLLVGANSDIELWNSAATTTTVDNTASVYSQDNANVDGALHVFGDYHIGTTTEYWSYATDFDGADLTGGSERIVTVEHAANATTTVDGGTLNIAGTSGNETAVTNQGSGTYAMEVNAGTFLAQYYNYRNLNSTGLFLTDAPIISTLSYGDFELAVAGGSLITLASTTLNANASMVITGNSFATTTAITGKNVTMVGSTSNAWTFTSHAGNLDGEAYDYDGVNDCDSIRWSDSSCLLTQQTNFRWRNDDGGAEVPNSEWYDADWDARKQVRVENVDATAYTDAVVQLFVAYDSDMQADFDDLRFTDSTGTTIIPHWTGSTTASAIAEVWVEVPSLPADDIATIFMYYNNPTALSTGSSTLTFIASDDFEDNNITEYSGQTSLFSTGTGFNFDGTYGLDNNGNESGRANTGGIYRFDQTVSQGETFRYMQYVDTSATSDEPCTMFGVQSPGSTNNNYAVCLEQFGTDRISLVKDIVDNDASGNILASSTVTYSTGWYEVEVDWGTDDSISVELYDSAGSLVTTISNTDSTYTSGGYGLTFWFHNGGWDSISSRPTLTTEPTTYYGVEMVDGGATWMAGQNVTGSADTGDTLRLRVSVENSGLAITNQNFLLEYAPRGAALSCGAVADVEYITVPVQASCGTSPICMQSSVNITNGAASVDLLTAVTGTYTAGELREDPSNTTGNIDIDQDEYTELEYVITPTSNVTDENTCLRVTDSGSELDTYLQVASLTVLFDPVLTSITLNDGLAISLLPGATTTVYATGTVSDLNGYSDIVLASSTIYRSGATGGAACSADNNDCYISTTATTCSFTNCSGDSCTVECYADVYFHADPTDDGTYSGEEWLAFVEVEDNAGGYDFASALGVELNTLRAIGVDGDINYGSLEVNNDTGSVNASTSVDNQGNVEINLEISGTDMTDGASSAVPAADQKFATSTFTYSSCGATVCSDLSSTTPVTLDVDLAKPAVDTPAVSDDVLWGIFIPFGVSSVAHQGINTFTPVSP